MGLLGFGRKARMPERTGLVIDGEERQVAVRRSDRARSYRLTIDPRGGPVLTVPANGSWAEAEKFLHRQRRWLAARLKRNGGPRRLEADALVPLRGVEHRISGSGQVRGQVRIEAGTGTPMLLVPGASEHLGRRLADWLKAEARRDLDVAVARHAIKLDVRPSGITVRDQSSRWGSCSSARRLNFNWRLILAPPHVLDYVAAHEVAHILEMNHSPAFWATVARTLPDMDRGRAWLKANGRGLMAWTD